MLLRELMWEFFRYTGSIDAYLAYREILEEPPLNSEAAPD